MNKTALWLSLWLTVQTASAQQPADDSTRIFQLGEVHITAKRHSSSLNKKQITQLHAQRLTEALSVMPSLTVSKTGSRAEAAVHLRGFDMRSVPLFIDGVPVSIPYDGYIDLGRFLSYTIEKIDLSKGYSPLSYGANTIGGAINLISSKPTAPFEAELMAGTGSGGMYEGSINLGSRHKKWYASASFSGLQQAYTPLSAAFDTTALQSDRKLKHSQQSDSQARGRLAYTPNATDEYSLTYAYAHGQKGNPTYLGKDPNTPQRYWDWPYWDSRSLYFISRTATGKNSMLKVNSYFHRFNNKLESYDDISYSSQDKRYAFTSYFDDYTLGSRIEFNRYEWKHHNLTASANIKNEHHAEHNEGESPRRFTDNTWSIALEDRWKPGNKTEVAGGVAYLLRHNLLAEDYSTTGSTTAPYTTPDDKVFNYQLAIFHQLNNFIKVYASAAWKNRFASMKDRYSYRGGRSLPNPGLSSEKALNLQVGSHLQRQQLSFRPELFYSRLYNTIQMVDHVQGNLSQVQNTGNSEFKGMDMELSYHPKGRWMSRLSYSYIEQKNLSHPGLLFVNIPKHHVVFVTSLELKKQYVIIFDGQWSSMRYNSSDGSRSSPAFFLFNLRAEWHSIAGIRLSTGINNIADKNYTIDEGYPEAGRTFYLSLSYRFSR